MMGLAEINRHEFERKKKEFIIDISVSSATTLSFVFQSTFLYGYVFLMFQENRQHRLHIEHQGSAADSLCPVLPILEVYLHGVAVTSILAFVVIGILYTSSLSPPTKEDRHTDSYKFEAYSNFSIPPGSIKNKSPTANFRLSNSIDKYIIKNGLFLAFNTIYMCSMFSSLS